MDTRQISSLLTSKGKVTISEFCEKWIPKMYKIQPDEHGYKKACITELSRLLQGSIKNSTIARTWKIDGIGGTDYPLYVEALLDLADQKNRILEIHGKLDDYSH